MQALIKNSSGNEVKNGWIAIGVIILSFIGFYLFSKNSDKSLGDNFVLINGFVSDAKVLNRTGNEVYYTFSFKGKYYNSSQPLPKFKNVEERFVLEGKVFPVIVDSTNYSNSKMLFDSSSFAQYGLEYPDSLKWLKQYLKSN